MKLNTKLTTLAAAVSLTTLLVACGGGGTSTAGIGGSGITSSGTITGFGSVFVNGVKFETTGSSFDIEGKIGAQSDLAIGMVVQVNGTINPDGVTGTATSIVFDDDLQGPVFGYPIPGDRANLTTATFTIMGVAVQIDRKTTYFDGDNISFDTIEDNDMVELSGFFDGTGKLIATRIESKENSDPEDRNKVEIKGTITNIGTNTFTLTNAFTAGITVDASSIGIINPFQNDDFVEVEGTYNRDTNTILATKIELEEFDYGDSHKFEMQGFVANYIDDSNFIVNGIPVDASDAVFEPSNIQLDNDLQVEVEGRFLNGVLIAEEIKMRGGEIEIQASVFSISKATNSFTVEFISNQLVTIDILPETKTKEGSYLTFLDYLKEGDFVEVEGYQGINNKVLASEIEISDSNSNDIEIKGIIESDPNLGNIKVLGIEFIIDGSTEFKDADGNVISRLPDFNDQVTRDQSLIKIEDSNPSDGIADKIEIED